MTKSYNKTTEQIMRDMNLTENGLTDFHVQESRGKYGYNELHEEKKDSWLKIFLEQFKDLLVVILLVAAAISGFLGKIESTLVILLVVVLNAVLGTVQQLKAEQSLNSLKKLSSPTAKVMRDGKKVVIDSREIVVGDLLFLDAGDYVSADGRIADSHGLYVNESSLTGESETVLKISEALDGNEIDLGDQINMVFSGSFVTNGRAEVIVTGIGMKTEIGKIADLLVHAKEKKTPLQKNLDQFGQKLAIGVLIITGIIMALDLFRGKPLIDAFMFSVSLAVAAIPEALSSIVTIVLSFGTQKMAKENAIIRKLHAVEVLGGVSVICSDKTGTLTQNKMTVKKIYVDGKALGDKEIDIADKPQSDLLLMALLCNDSVTLEGKEIGDPTEIAMVNLGEQHGMDEIKIREKYTRIAEIPFDSDRKLMSTLHSIDQKTIMITKGAPDILLGNSKSIETSEGIRPLKAEDMENIMDIHNEFSKKGLRVLSFGFKYMENDEVCLDDEKDLVFSGLMAMMDPPREEAYEAIKVAKSAGIRTVMITGDHRITASAIASELGILAEGDRVLEGKDLEKMLDEELEKEVQNISVYARVSPEHKIRIVRAWQKNGKIVSMTGDGVNDAPALKQADIGVAMGITGTEVSKDASSMILTDDNFSTIVKAVSNGRSIYENIKNAVKFLISGNTSGLLTVIFASLANLPSPFLPVHLLFINLVTDSLPAIAIGLEPSNESLMKEKPRNSQDSIIDKLFIHNVALTGTLMAVVTIAAFLIGLQTGGAKLGSTMAFATLGMARLFHGFNSRSRESLFKIGLFTNRILWGAVLLGLGLFLLIMNIKPLMRVFEVAPITIEEQVLVMGLAILPTIIIQFKRLIVEKYSKKNKTML